MKSPAGSEPLTSLAAVQEHRRCARCLAMGHRHRQVVERIARHRHRVQTGPVPVDPSWRDAAGCREGHLRTGNCTLRSSTATVAKLVASSLVSRCKLDPRLALGRLHRSRGQRGPRPPHGCSDPPPGWSSPWSRLANSLLDSWYSSTPAPEALVRPPSTSPPAARCGHQILGGATLLCGEVFL